MSADAEIQVHDDAEAAAQSAAWHLAEAAARGGHIALSGGSARASYDAAARLESRWSKVHLWWVDERCVPPDDALSNYRLVRESLLDRLAVPPETINRVRCERPVEEAAALYDESLAGVTLDLAFLGIGPDGHVASLFPGSAALDEHERRAVAVAAGMEPLVPRVTMTPPVLTSARLAVYLVTGAEKAAAARRAFTEPPDPATPASVVRGQRTVVLLDAAAASATELAVGRN